MGPDPRITLYDHCGTPAWRFPHAVLTLTESLGFREGGALTGCIEIDDDGVRGTFTAEAECLPWRTPGS